MARFFIDRPVFAWVLAIFIILAGVLAIPRLAVERYPAVAPPSVSIYASYPGASPQTLNDAVVGLIERELSSVKHLLYFESSVDTSGEASITATFKPGTNRSWRRWTCRTGSRRSSRACRAACARTACSWRPPIPAS
jgi:multidrug efflux pump